MDQPIDIKDIVAILPKYQGLIFDLDGTLVDLGVDWAGLKRKLTDYCLLKKNIRIEFSPLDQKLLSAKTLWGEQFYSELLAIVADFEMQEANYKFNEKLLVYVNAALYQKIAIYSMNTRVCVDNIVKKYFKKIPDIIITKNSCLEPKPTGKDILYILHQWNFKDREVAFIGNTEQDFISGQRAVVDTFIIRFIAL